MKGNKSTYAYYDYGTCVDCFIFWLDGRQDAIQRWKDGWRPDAKEVERMKAFMKD